MKKNLIGAIIFYALICSTVPAIAAGDGIEPIRLPYEAGQSFVVVQGYDSLPTHINQEAYAIDFSQNGCDAYGKLAVAASSGKVMLAEETGYNSGYGTQVLVVNDKNIVARYAHLIPGTIPVRAGDAVVQGEPLGKIGNTGLVAGAACPTHPGTHLHFAMYGGAGIGPFSPLLPEPISNYIGITAKRWYLSDNGIALATIPGTTAIIEKVVQPLLSPPVSPAPAPILVARGGGVSASPPPPASEPATASPPSTPAPALPVSPSSSLELFSSTPSSTTLLQDASSTQPAASSTQSDASSTVTGVTTTIAATPTIFVASTSFNTTTLAIDLAWQPPQNASSTTASTTTTYAIFYGPGTSTLLAMTTSTNFSYQLSSSDFGTTSQFTIEATDDFGYLSTIQTIPIALPEWFTATAIQPIDNENSNGSWYSDNWYELGNGFSGVIRSLTLEGFVNSSNYFASHVWLDEYLDPAYSQLNQRFTITGDAPFTNGLQKITITGLDIPLQPENYYRLATYQDYQNRSVILAGTSATGTAMWNEFIGGTGAVRHQYPFYPYLSGLIMPL